MTKIIYTILIILLTLLLMDYESQKKFNLNILGSKEGFLVSNISGFLLTDKNSKQYIYLNANPLAHSHKRASQAGYFLHLKNVSNTKERPTFVLHSSSSYSLPLPYLPYTPKHYKKIHLLKHQL